MMEVQVLRSGSIVNGNIENDSFISMKELGSMQLKVNHLSIFIKKAIISMIFGNSDKERNEVIAIDSAINNINLELFINGVSEGNSSVRHLLTDNILYELMKHGVIHNSINFDSIYNILGVD